MKPEVMWSFVADLFILDQSGKFSIVGAWESITAMNFPAVHPQLFLITGWRGDPLATFMTETKLWMPSGALLSTTGNHPVHLSTAGKGLNVNQMVNLQFPQAGEYTIELFHFGDQAWTGKIAVQRAAQDVSG
jgi:hypothetical protein